jgi:NADH dehydrogenase FAD-containing subunit
MKRLVLIGAGHSHAQVLREWAHAPLPDVEVTVVSPIALAPYSGMVPGWLAGTYGFDDICIDFQGLAHAAGARWLKDELFRLDTQRQVVVLASGAVLPYDLLSLNVGSTLVPPALPGATVLPLRPLAGLRDAWDDVLQCWRASPS